jgi:hypothetical protein
MRGVSIILREFTATFGGGFADGSLRAPGRTVRENGNGVVAGSAVRVWFERCSNGCHGSIAAGGFPHWNKRRLLEFSTTGRLTAGSRIRIRLFVIAQDE